MDVTNFASINSPERHRRLNRGMSMPPQRKEQGIFGSPKAQHGPNHPAWWQALKGLGKRRRKSTTSAKAENTIEMTWHVNQVEKLSNEKKSTGEFVSCLSFDETGELLGAGCKNGMITVYSQDTESQKTVANDGSERGTYRNQSFVPFISFQSHESEFDYLRSVEIDEKIVKLRWLKRRNPAHFLLATNERTVKLWRVSERHKELESQEKDQRSNINKSYCTWSGSTLRIPRFRKIDRTVVATPRRNFFEAHDYRINSLSVNSDLETFITADDLRINLWHLEVPHQTFNIVDTKPAASEELSEVITTAEFHPFKCALFVYGNSKGTIRLCDLRSQARCDKQARTFVDKVDEGSKTFFSDIIGCISDLKFSESGRYLLARDYLNLKIWDLQMESKPVETYPICPDLRSKLCMLYESDHIFDKFDCSWGCNDRFVVSGTYSNYLKIHDRTSGRGVMLDSSYTSAQNNKSNWKGKHTFDSKSKVTEEVRLDSLDFKKKLLRAAWRPNENQLTNAVGNSLVFLRGRDRTPELV